MRAPRLRRDEGATTLELALVLPLFLLLVGALLTLGLRVFYGALAEHAAGEALREATLHRPGQGYGDSTRAKAVVDEQLGGLVESESVSVTAQRPPGNAFARQGDEVTVTVTYSIDAIRAAARLVPFGLLDEQLAALADIETSAEGRRE